MPKWNPCKRRVFIKKLVKLGFNALSFILPSLLSPASPYKILTADEQRWNTDCADDADARGSVKIRLICVIRVPRRGGGAFSFFINDLRLFDILAGL